MRSKMALYLRAFALPALMRFWLIKRREKSTNGIWKTPCARSAFRTFGSWRTELKKPLTVPASYPFCTASFFNWPTKPEKLPPHSCALATVEKDTKSVAARMDLNINIFPLGHSLKQPIRFANWGNAQMITIRPTQTNVNIHARHRAAFAARIVAAPGVCVPDGCTKGKSVITPS